MPGMYTLVFTILLKLNVAIYEIHTLLFADFVKQTPMKMVIVITYINVKCVSRRFMLTI